MASYINAADLGAVADCIFIEDATVTAADATLTSASNPFSLADQGKSIVVAGAGASGVPLVTTIASFNNAGSVELAALAATTVTGAKAHFGTDNTSAINSALSSLTNGGKVFLNAGYFLVRSVNLTNTNSKALEGAAMGINANGKGTVLVPLTASNIVDLTGTGHGALRNIQIGTTRSAQIANVGVLCAQSSLGEFSSLLDLHDVMVTGSYNVAGLYVYGIGDSKADGLYVWNHIQTGKSAAVFTRDNVASITSEYVTIATGERTTGNWNIQNFEFHESHYTSQSTGNALRLRGAGKFTFGIGYVDSPSSVGGLQIENSASATPCGDLHFEAVTFASEQAQKCSYNINFAGACVNISFGPNCSFDNLSGYFQGSGAVSSRRGIPLTHVMTPGVYNGGNSTVFFGPGITGPDEFSVGALLQTRMLVCDLYAQANSNISTGAHVLTVMRNGSATAISATITAAPTGADNSHYAVFEKGDRIAIRDAAYSNANHVRWTAGLTGIPF